MTSDNNDSLLAEYPEFFSQEGSPFIFWCEDGWYSIIWGLLAQIRELKISNLRAIEVKEKFGYLRIHFNYQELQNLSENLRTELDGLIEVAVKQSGWTCELCGIRGRIRKIKQKVQALCGNCFDVLLRDQA